MLKWLSPTAKTTDQIVEIDVATGTLLRTIVQRSSLTYFDITLTPDGKGVFVAGRQPDTLDVLALESGRVLNSIDARNLVTLVPSNPAVIGFSPDGRTAYAQWFDERRNMGGVRSWRWQDENVAIALVESPGFQDSPRAWPRIFFLRDHCGAAGAPRFFSIPHFMALYGTNSFAVKLHASPGTEQSIELGTAADPYNTAAVSVDGSLAFFLGEGRGHVLVLDWDSGTVFKTGSTGFMSVGSLARSSGGGYLLLGGSPIVSVRDTAQHKSFVDLTVPSEFSSASPSISADGRWVAAVCNRISYSKGLVRSIVVWDLGTHRLTE